MRRGARTECNNCGVASLFIANQMVAYVKIMQLANEIPERHDVSLYTINIIRLHLSSPSCFGATKLPSIASHFIQNEQTPTIIRTEHNRNRLTGWQRCCHLLQDTDRICTIRSKREQ
jgi:hypothetical protein